VQLRALGQTKAVPWARRPRPGARGWSIETSYSRPIASRMSTRRRPPGRG
jgi:hypothetical protein